MSNNTPDFQSSQLRIDILQNFNTNIFYRESIKEIQLNAIIQIVDSNGSIVQSLSPTTPLFNLNSTLYYFNGSKVTEFERPKDSYFNVDYYLNGQYFMSGRIEELSKRKRITHLYCFKIEVVGRSDIPAVFTSPVKVKSKPKSVGVITSSPPPLNSKKRANGQTENPSNSTQNKMSKKRKSDQNANFVTPTQFFLRRTVLTK